MVKGSFLKNLRVEPVVSLGFELSPKDRSSKQDKTVSTAVSKPVDIARPAELTTPVIFASPHSGRQYPHDLLSRTRLDARALRLSEDGYVDLLFDSAPRYGAPLLRALFPRAYVDVNRSARELDPIMFQGNLPAGTDSKSSRVLAGLGVIPRIVADGQNIYTSKLSVAEAAQRLKACYEPYHAALSGLITEAMDKFGTAIIIDCHSMPSAGGVPLRPGEPAVDFVLGDRFGVSSAPCLPGLIETVLHRHQRHVVRNAPYAGGYVANAYGRPSRGVHVLQIEINRGLYLDETRITRTEGFDKLRLIIEDLIAELTQIDPEALRPAAAAE